MDACSPRSGTRYPVRSEGSHSLWMRARRVQEDVWGV